jgi:phosphoenolpyruvate carboxykinase (ATP)
MSVHTTVPEPTDYPDPATAGHVTPNPTFAELCKLAAVDKTITEHASLSYVSEYRPQGADATANAVDDEFDGDDYDAFARRVEWVNNTDSDVVCLNRSVGRHPETSYACRLFLFAEYARIALSWAKLIEPVLD